MNLQAITGNRVFKLLRETFDAWMEDNALRLSAALAYYSTFSIAPLLVIAISIAGLATGAAVTALLFELGQFGLGIYLGRASTASSFGAAGSVVLLLLWVYYASAILLFGAEFTRAYARRRGMKSNPRQGPRP